MPDDSQPLNDSQARRAMANAIVCQCFGALAIVALQNNLFFLYFRALGVKPSVIITLFAIVPFLQFSLLMPFARLADRFGKRRVGIAGSAISGLGIGIMLLAGATESQARFWLLSGGIGMFGVGYTGFVAGWFALLSPVVPESLRGRFFGALRVSWQIVGAIFTGVMALVLSADSPVSAYIALVSFVALSQFLRIPFYRRIPEIERPEGVKERLRVAVLRILRVDGFASFCSYVFLISLFIGCCPLLFSLVQKDVHGFSDRLVAFNGNLVIAGNVFGFFLGGLAVDRLGTRLVFVVCHFGFGGVLLFFVGRGYTGIPLEWSIGLGVFLFAFLMAAGSIAFSTEMLALLPDRGKSLAAALFGMMNQGGVALSGFLSARALELGALSEEWTFLGKTLTAYDTILLGCGVMIVLLVVTLSLVPSVLKRKAEWMPRGY